MAMPPESSTTPSRDDILNDYLALLPYDPYPVQEEALLAWFTSPQGVLVCAPTGTGKTLIAESAVYEALVTGRTMYYTTPLIALTEQKFHELQQSAVEWGFSADDVGMVTGHRKINPKAKVLVVVAEILLNRLLHKEAFDFANVSAVVMDEFHSFADPGRGIVWELSLGLLPKHVGLMLLSATVGNAVEFLSWLRHNHDRDIELVQGTERKVPLRFQWVGDQLLNEHLQWMAEGDEQARRTPALLFCFNRAECWTTAEQLKGKSLLSDGQQKALARELDDFDWRPGAGTKLKQILMRGVGVHHAGLLPLYRRLVETLFQQKLLTVCVCTETLAAGINLPARSVVLSSLLKGPKGKKKLVDASSAHQIFGRAGRPQFDSEGFVFALAHEDDVKIHRWQEKYDQIPEDTKDPQLIKAKKQLKKKAPTRNKNIQYWSEAQFEKLRTAPAGNLSSKGQMPWRLLAYLLKLSPEVDRVRDFISQRMLDAKQLEQNEKALKDKLITLHRGGFVRLDPEPPPPEPVTGEPSEKKKQQAPAKPKSATTGLAAVLQDAINKKAKEAGLHVPDSAKEKSEKKPQSPLAAYEPKLATPTEKLNDLLAFRSINPVFACYLLEYLGHGDEFERLQALESVLELPITVARLVRVPRPEVLPQGPLAIEHLNSEVLQRGLATEQQILGQWDEDEDLEERLPPLAVADKLKLLFQSDYPSVNDMNVVSIWCLGDLLQFNGDFHKYITARDLAKEEGMIFRHALRMILLIDEFRQVTPLEMPPEQWREELRQLKAKLTETCQAVDSHSTEEILESQQHEEDPEFDEFGKGLF